MPEGSISLERMCRHCGAVDTRRIGYCSVCGMAVCEKCGNLQHVRGEKRATHNACLKEDDSGFSMIKFVK
ncbi:MAG TPA: hypothetical protein VF902_09850 [Coriobacteriia bacterium]